MLDGAARVSEVVAAAAADRQPAVAITDHGVMYGVVDFVKAAREEGIKPLIGIEAYVTPGSRFDRPRRSQNIRYHMTLLAANETGYRNLMKLASRAYLEGYYYKPRMDSELLAEHSEGIIATSGCLGGPVAQHLAPDASREEGIAGAVRDVDAAVAAAAHYQDIFGQGQLLHRDPGPRVRSPSAGSFPTWWTSPAGSGPRSSPPTTPITPGGRRQRPMTCCSASRPAPPTTSPTGSVSTPRSSISSRPSEMRALFPSDQYPGACDNTLLVAERATVDLEFGRILLPQFAVPSGHTESSYLRHLVMSGAVQRYGDPCLRRSPPGSTTNCR